ncbi:hypothetical protein EXIGLDRAFT_809114 [Exidia glandulosa HHB12029]|uniref:Uncharacterized protein n=1 Tax=Exidia glandulosa HHB12029 TaxID=1314781 RepID=A0A165Q2P0_EXIGL|nr:hypothetical protein EXIGLDRAFT_809114 [Exidia glandulosa HHB12029]
MNTPNFYAMVPRYSRSETGTMIHYGEGLPAQINVWGMKHFTDLVAGWTKEIGATPAFGAKLCEDKMLMLLISAQCTEIMRIWQGILAQPKGKGKNTSLPLTRLDALMCDALDTLRELEDKAENLEAVEYHTRITQQCFDGDECRCGVCEPSEESFKQMCARVKRWRKILPATVFQRVISELEQQ